MTSRQVVIGCSVTAVVIVLTIGVGGYMVFRHLASPATLPSPTSLVASDSVGLALLRLESDNEWLKEAFTHISARSRSSPDLEKITPFEVVWTARQTAPASVGHLVVLSLSPAGRLFGLSLDVALWKAGRAGEPLAHRVVHGGEGITSFPGAHIPGQFFVHGSTIAWGSDLDAAQRGVDLLVEGERNPAQAAVPVLDLYPAGGRHALRGAMIDQGGSLARLLAALPGAASPPPELAGMNGLSFTIDPSAGTEATGEIHLRWSDAVSADQRQQVAATLASWIGTVSPAGVRLQAAPSEQSPGDALALTASDLDGIFDALLRAAARAERAMKRAEAEGVPDNQSSSTFQ